MVGLLTSATIGATVRLLGGTGLVFWSSTTIYKRKSSGVGVGSNEKAKAKGTNKE